ncbi:MAG: ABC transporter ATP-binding protein [Candidatus Atribacteria bacterium]|nr:ABC transporter ATP-binding protein [Candidatus Atribacteria bacterium]
MNENIIETEGLTKYYGPILGIKDLNLQVKRGEIFGYLGPNGAGKTTTIKLLLDLIHPTKGRVKIFGLDAHRDTLEIRKKIGYMTVDFSLYENMTGEEFLIFCQSFYSNKDKRFKEKLIKKFEIKMEGKIKTYSHGTKQKLALAQALLHQPELLILDEPTIGLDPLMQNVFLNLIKEQKSEGKTIFMSSHILSEVEKICDRIGILKKGTLIVTKNINELKRTNERTLRVVFQKEVPEKELEMKGITKIEKEGNKYILTITGNEKQILKKINSYPLFSLNFEEADLEDIFLRYFKNNEEK